MNKSNLPLHPSVIEPLPMIEGGWPVICSDPPWYYRSWAPANMEKGDRSVENHYRTMRLDEIKALPVKDIAAKDSHLFLWITGPFLPRAEEVMRAWGYKYSATAFVWMKLKRSTGDDMYQWVTLAELHKYLHFGLGHTTRKNVEFCLLGRRGNAKRIAKNIMEPILSPVREHSRKPDESYERIMRYADGPYLEMFSRENRDGWSVWGNQTALFNEATS